MYADRACHGPCDQKPQQRIVGAFPEPYLAVCQVRMRPEVLRTVRREPPCQSSKHDKRHTTGQGSLFGVPNDNSSLNAADQSLPAVTAKATKLTHVQLIS